MAVQAKFQNQSGEQTGNRTAGAKAPGQMAVVKHNAKPDPQSRTHKQQRQNPYPRIIRAVRRVITALGQQRPVAQPVIDLLEHTPEKICIGHIIILPAGCGGDILKQR
ncbi:hypothetical protein D3C75_832370 [compost metagenome]